MDCRGITRVGFVVAGGDAPELFDPLEEILDEKKFSTRCLHLYISASCGIGALRSDLAGMTAMAPRALSVARKVSLSNALSPRRAPKSTPAINGSTPMLS